MVGSANALPGMKQYYSMLKEGSDPLDGMSDVALNTVKNDPLSAAKWLGLLVEPLVKYLGEPPKGIYSERVIPELEKEITAQLAPESPQHATWVQYYEELIAIIANDIKIEAYQRLKKDARDGES